MHGKNGPIAFSTQMDLWPFVATLFALGFFMSLGKAAVFKHIPVYYPNHVGAVGGLVGMIGGLGGFILPIVFGALLDLTGVYTSCFALLLAVVVVSLAWMHFSIRAMERQAQGKALDQLPALSRRYAELSVPIHVLGAESDALVTPAQHAALLAEASGMVRLTLVPGGHMLPITQPRLVAAWLRDVAKDMTENVAAEAGLRTPTSPDP